MFTAAKLGLGGRRARMISVVFVCLAWCGAIEAKSVFPVEIVSSEPSTDVNDVRFLLYTPEDPNSGLEVPFNNTSEAINVHFDPGRSTKILVHGYTDDAYAGWVQNMKDKYLTKGDFNIFAIDWGKLAGPSPFYFIAADNVKPVGQHVAQFIQSLSAETSAPLESFHPIGFSLGGQVVGQIGYFTNGELDRITGLDPAGFLFHTVPESDRLSKEDAKFVDVVHSAGLWIGTDEIVGHVDFYPNSGMAPMPGCEGEDISLPCSHARAPAYFAESINSEVGFESVACPSWEDFEAGICDNATSRNHLGDPVDRNNPGVFYLKTNSQQPYAIPPSQK